MDYLFEGTVFPADRAESVYLYLPFKVASDVTRIDVTYSFDETGSILDLGLFDSNLQSFPSTKGFRGWSGSFRRSIFVARDAATPGYIPGEIEVGTWQVVLGLAKVAPSGCGYRVEVNCDNAPRPLIAPAGRVAVSKTEKGLYKGDLQSHSFYSDAKGSPEDLVAVAHERGLEFLAVTDHNTHSHHRKLAELSSPELLLIPGEEITTYRGHANVWGVDGWVDFRIENDPDLEKLIEHVHQRGGLFSVNHPKAIPNCLGCDWEYPIPNSVDSVEVWQGPWLYKNWESLERYDALLKAGRRVALVGGSDRHQAGYPDPDPEILQLGSPTTWLWLEDLSVKSVLNAIRAGRGFVSESPQGPRLELDIAGANMGGSMTPSHTKVTARARVKDARGDLLHWVGEQGVLREVVIETDHYTDRWQWEPKGNYVRLEVIAEASLQGLEAELENLSKGAKMPTQSSAKTLLDRPWRRALSNPVYLGYS